MQIKIFTLCNCSKTLAASESISTKEFNNSLMELSINMDELSILDETLLLERLGFDLISFNSLKIALAFSFEIFSNLRI